MPADGSWKLITVEWTIPIDDHAEFYVKPRALGIDQVSLVVVP